VEGTDRSIVQELMFSGGVSYLGLHIAGDPNACELTKGFVQSVGGKGQIRTSGTYAILKVPLESTTDVAYHLRGSLSNILSENIPSRFPHQVRLEAYNPEVEGQYDLTIWTMTGKYKLP
jgi:hypothetical protein